MKLSSIGAVALGLILAGATLAAPSPAPAQPVQAAAIELSPYHLIPGASSQQMAVPVGRARTIRLPADARDVVLGNPGAANIVIKSPRLAVVFGIAPGGTTALFFDEEGVEIGRIEIQVGADAMAAQLALRDLMPNANVDVKAIGSTLYLTGTVRSNDMAENARTIASSVSGNVISLLRIIEDQQVLLQVRVAEVSRDVTKNLGVELSGTATFGDVAWTLASGGPLPGAFGSGSFTYASGGDTFTAAIEALETNGLLRTLAEPNLTAISGETANFLAGGEFPIPVAQESGAIAITFRQFGVGLNFTPVVLNSGRISLRLATEVSAPDPSVAVSLCAGCTPVPGLITRRAETTVEIPSGGSLVIAGLLQSDLGTGISGLPYLKDIPVLGPFFRTNNIERNERELVVAVTAFLVHPVDPQDILLSTKDIAAPTDWELFFLGRLEAIYGTREDEGPATAASLKGPIGYIIQ